ncbi:MAG TPA: NUDIX hydrolase [Actinomycetota bacterium]|nr:NUDIX hydrolase [Actinomycetota bacterium]
MVRHPGAVAVVALTRDGAVVLVRQRREAVRETLLEVPAGILDVAGEAPQDAARRELREETGYEADVWEPLGAILSSPGFSDERVELFAARGAERVTEPEEGIEVVVMAHGEALRAVRDGTIADAKSAGALLLSAASA